MSGRILVVRGGALGDFILGLPALRALRGAFRQGRLTLIAPAAVLPLASSLVDSAVALELAESAALFGEAPPPAEVVERYAGLDLAVVWLADPEGLVRRNLERLGARRILWAPALPPKDAGIHATDHLLGTLAGIAHASPAPDAGNGAGAEVDRPHPDPLPLGEGDGPRLGRPRAGGGGPAPRVDVEPADRARAAEMLGRLGFEAGQRVVAVHPGSGGRRKCWPAERFARVAEALGAEGIGVALVQGPADGEIVADVLKALGGAPPPVVSDLPVRDLAALLSLCATYLGNDSGVTHLAAAVGTPTVALFGPTDPAVWGPRGERVTILRGREGRLEEVTVHRVVETVLKGASESSGGPLGTQD